jgi:hypothetical protein
MFIGKWSAYAYAASGFLAVLGAGLIVLAIAWWAMYPKSISEVGVGFWFMTGMFWLLFSLLLFERHSFYRIIERQNHRIADLESKRLHDLNSSDTE